jgi:hypothetical protein
VNKHNKKENPPMKFRLLSLGIALGALSCVQLATATVTPTAWYHFGDGGIAIQNDATANSNNFNSAYFQCTVPPVGPNGVGGPLGASGYISTNSARFGANGCISEFYQAGTLNPVTTNFYVPPPTNYGMEVWFMPQDAGYVSDGSQLGFTPIIACGGSIFGAGPGGGTAFVVDSAGIHAAVVRAGDSAGAYIFFGPTVTLDTNNWIHLALVNDNGTLTFYTNGLPCATNDNNTIPLTAPAGSLFIGRDGGHVSIDGFLDEARIFTFAPGAFSTADLLFRASPRSIGIPQSTTVWNGGAANILANVALDTGNTYQWYQGTTLLGGQISSDLNLDPVALGQSGNTYYCAVTNNGNGLVTSNATLTVVPVQTANVNAYRSAVTSEPSLLAYFPGDGSTGTTLANTVDGTHNGTLESGAVYDGQTNRAFGERAVLLQGNGNVQIASSASYEFSGGNGTIEGLIYLIPPPTGQKGTIFSIAAADGSGIHYAFGASADGATLTYTNDAGVSLTWAAPANLLNRFAHVALVFSGTTSVTAYLDGQSLGTKSQTGFGSATGVPVWIGSVGSSGALWNGTIDEVAVYGSALTATKIAIHNADFILGTNTSAPTIVSQSSSKTIYAGGTVVLSVAASGTPPLSYSWFSNGVPISGSTSPTLTLSQVKTNASAAYTVNIVNSFGSTNNNTSPVNLTVVTAPAGYAAAVMADNPSAFWRLDESSGTKMTDYAGELDGAYSGTVTLGAAGITSDPAVLFGGGVGAVPYSSILNPGGAFTVEFWAKPADANTHAAIASQNRAAGRLGYVIYNDNGSFIGQTHNWEGQLGNSSGVTVFLVGTTTVVPGTWYHVAMTYDGGSNATLYVFGYPEATSTNAGGGNYVPNASVPFQIAQRTSGGAFPFNGELDEVAFYNYALSQSQLQSHVTIGLPIRLGIAPSTTVVADTKPVGIPYNGFNAGASWVASEFDGTSLRSGVMHFTAIAGTNKADQVYVPAYSDLLNTNGTLMFWLRAGTNVPSSGYAQGPSAPLVQWRNNNGGCGFYINNDQTLFVQAMNNYCNFNSIGNVADGKWHNVAFTFDQGPGGGITCYLDGALDSQGFNSQAWHWTPTAVVELGTDFNDGYWQNYNGSLDDVRMYNRILTQSEIQSAMSGSIGIVDISSLKLRLEFDAPPGGLAVSWIYGSLQVAPGLTGAFTTISNASSPYPVAPALAPQSYFRAQR